MSRLIFLLLLCFFIHANKTTAQINYNSDFEVSISAKSYSHISPDVKRYYKNKNGQVLYLKFSPYAVDVQLYNIEQQTVIKTISTRISKAIIEIQDVLFLNDRLFLLISKEKSSYTSFYYREIYFETGVVGPEVLIFNTKGPVGRFIEGRSPQQTLMNGDFFTEKKDNWFNLYYSRDSTKLLIAFKGKTMINQVGYYVLDNNLSFKWGFQKNITPITENFDPLTWLVTNDGNVYMSYVSPYSKTLNLYKCNKDGSYASTILANDFARVSTNHEMFELNNGRINYSYFNSITDYGGIVHAVQNLSNGLSYSVIDSNLNVISSKFELLPLPLINEGLKEKTVKFNNKNKAKGDAYGIPELKLTKIKEYKNGSVLYIGDKIYVSGYEPDLSFSHYKTVLMLFDSVGNHLWSNNVVQVQIGSDRRIGVGYGLVETEKYIYCFYLENIKNIENPSLYDPVPYYNYKKGVLAYNRITKTTGAMVKHNVLDLNPKEGISIREVNINDPMRISESEIIFEVQSDKKSDATLKLKFK